MGKHACHRIQITNEPIIISNSIHFSRNWKWEQVLLSLCILLCLVRSLVPLASIYFSHACMRDSTMEMGTTLSGMASGESRRRLASVLEAAEVFSPHTRAQMIPSSSIFTVSMKMIWTTSRPCSPLPSPSVFLPSLQ